MIRAALGPRVAVGRPWMPGALLFLVAVAVGACTGGSAVSDPSPGAIAGLVTTPGFALGGVPEPDGDPGARPDPVVVRVLAATGRLGLVTWGSSSCPIVPTKVAVVDRRHLRVEVAELGGPTCTADLSATTSSFLLDAATTDVAGPLTVQVHGGGIDVEMTAPVA